MNRNYVLARLFATLNLLTIICAFTPAPAAASTIVKFRQIQTKIIVQVVVNQTGPFDFIFDTGSTTTLIDLDLAKRLSLSSTESASMLTMAGSRSVPRYSLESLTIGSKCVQNVRVLCSELREIHAISPRIRGVLGENVLSGFDYILNYRDQSIEFEENGEFANTLQGARLSVGKDGGIVLIATKPSSPNKQASTFVLDSGASSFVIFRTASRRTDLEIDLRSSNMITVWTASGNRTAWTGRLRQLRIGSETISDLPVIVVDNRNAIDGSFENGLLPTRLFRSIYFNNAKNFVILNPQATGRR